MFSNLLFLKEFDEAIQASKIKALLCAHLSENNNPIIAISLNVDLIGHVTI